MLTNFPIHVNAFFESSKIIPDEERQSTATVVIYCDMNIGRKRLVRTPSWEYTRNMNAIFFLTEEKRVMKCSCVGAIQLDTIRTFCVCFDSVRVVIIHKMCVLPAPKDVKKDKDYL